MQALLTALLANVSGGRVYWLRAQRGAQRPFVVLQTISGQSDHHFQGASGYRVFRVQADCYGDSYEAARNLATDLRRVLDGHRDANLQGIFLESERDLPDEDTGEVNRLARISLDFMVHYGES